MQGENLICLSVGKLDIAGNLDILSRRVFPIIPAGKKGGLQAMAAQHGKPCFLNGGEASSKEDNAFLQPGTAEASLSEKQGNNLH